MSYDIDSLRDQIPYYLTEGRESLLRALADFFAGKCPDYLLNRHVDQVLQGDGWRGFELYDLERNRKASVFGIVISNSCDVSPENKRHVQSRITFAPLVKLSRYRSSLTNSGISRDTINNMTKATREQKVTNIFYLPAGGVTVQIPPHFRW